MLRETLRRHLYISWRTLCLVAVQFTMVGEAAHAQWFLEDARLVDVRVGELSSQVNDMASGTGLLSDGTEYSFSRWYSSNWEDLRFTMMTPVSDNLGIYWGFGTGESGNKYQIDPSVKLGFVATEPITDNSFLSLSFSVVLGGYLREETCTADYGAIGGLQTVNCRMASSPLPPADTLDFLVDEPPADQVSISLRYQLRF